ncbi:transporter substrate-binding domain-containing protein [bacterium]|nr:transporter substrate-binding domain-containing protein [bacterium]
MNSLVKKISVFVAALSFIGVGAIASGKTLQISVDNANPPFMSGKGNKAEGIYPAIVKAAFAKTKFKTEIKAWPWKRLIAKIDAAEAGVAGIYKNSDREKKYDYSKQIISEKLVLFVRNDSSFSFKNISDLSGKKIGVIRGWSYGDDFDAAKKANKFKTEEAKSDSVNFKKLGSGRLDACIAIVEAGRSQLASQNLKGKIKYLDKPLAVNPVYLTFNKKANNKDAIAAFDKAIDGMKASGELTKIVDSFL